MEIKITKEKIEIFFLGLHKRDFNFNTEKVLKLKNYKNSIKTNFFNYTHNLNKRFECSFLSW